MSSTTTSSSDLPENVNPTATESPRVPSTMLTKRISPSHHPKRLQRLEVRRKHPFSSIAGTLMVRCAVAELDSCRSPNSRARAQDFSSCLGSWCNRIPSEVGVVVEGFWRCFSQNKFPSQTLPECVRLGLRLGGTHEIIDLVCSRPHKIKQLPRPLLQTPELSRQWQTSDFGQN